MNEFKGKAAKLEKFKYPLIVLVLGIALMLIPGKSAIIDEASDTDEPLKTVLSCTNGVGRLSHRIAVLSWCATARKTQRSGWILSALSAHILDLPQIRSQYLK